MPAAPSYIATGQIPSLCTLAEWPWSVSRFLAKVAAKTVSHQPRCDTVMAERAWGQAWRGGCSTVCVRLISGGGSLARWTPISTFYRSRDVNNEGFSAPASPVKADKVTMSHSAVHRTTLKLPTPWSDVRPRVDFETRHASDAGAL